MNGAGMLYKIITLAFLLLLLLSGRAYSEAQKTHYLCVFDPVGRNGDVYSMAKDIALDFLSLGVKLSLYPYSTESAAKADFRAGLCDAVALTGIHARDYNKFASSIEAIGAISNYDDMWTVVSTLAQDRVAPLFVENGLEIAGIYPAGAMYVFVKDKEIKAPEDFVGVRMITLYKDKISHGIANSIGAVAVNGDTTNFAAKFKRGRVDVISAPAAVTEALELDKAMGSAGGVIDIPLWMLTLQVVIRPEKFPAGFGQQARELSLDYFDTVIDGIVKKAEQKLDGFWIKTDDQVKSQWQPVFAKLRSDMAEEGEYDPRMLKLLKKLRCRSHPERDECVVN